MSDPVIAWQHTKDRQLVRKRGIDKSGFIEAYENVPKNVREVEEKFGDSIFFAVIRKNPKNDDFQMSQDSSLIDKLTGVDYTKEDLERILV